MESTSPSNSSVCRAFCESFPLGRERKHEKLVEFLMNHASTRSKLDGWLHAEEQKNPVQSANDENGSCTIKNENATQHKNDSVSMKERQLGNDNFKKKNLQESFQHYNRAIKFAGFSNLPCDKSLDTRQDPDCNNNFTIALANRSAVLTELGSKYYEKALKDADLALKYGYPQHLQHKLLCRKACIYIRQGNHKLAQECLDLMENESEVDTAPSDKSSHLSQDICDKIRDMKIEIERLKGLTTRNNSSGSLTNETNLPEFKENASFVSASDKVTLQTASSSGRHVIAGEDLTKGTMLFNEEPFSSVLLSEFYETHCHHCHKPLEAICNNVYYFPCGRCTQVMFCDDRCSEAADVYHQYECQWLDLMHAVGIAHLAFRTVLVAGVNRVFDCIENHNFLSDVTNISIFKKGTDSYRRVYSLLDHIPEMFEEDVFQYSLTASLLTKLLIQKTNLLQGIGYSKQLQFGGVILRHVCQLICNAHAITDVMEEDDTYDRHVPSVIAENQKRIATAIFPAASMMNHSCNPNITFQFQNGRTLTVQASQSVMKGDNVFNCYGPHFRRMSRNERQEILAQQYFFNCHCGECTNELKCGLSFADQFNAFKCTKCDGPVLSDNVSKDCTSKCTSCGDSQDMKPKFDAWNKATSCMKQGDTFMEQNKNMNEAINALELSYCLASKVLHKYNSDMGRICDSLARCYVMAGKFGDALKLLEQSLKYVEARFGPTSVEFARELKKYEEVNEELRRKTQ